MKQGSTFQSWVASQPSPATPHRRHLLGGRADRTAPQTPPAGSFIPSPRGDRRDALGRVAAGRALPEPRGERSGAPRPEDRAAPPGPPPSPPGPMGDSVFGEKPALRYAVSAGQGGFWGGDLGVYRGAGGCWPLCGAEPLAPLVWGARGASSRCCYFLRWGLCC